MSAQLQDRLTIVIPTYQRPVQASRALHYWLGQDVRVIMIDGSATPLALPAPVAKAIHITYLHMPFSLSARLGHVTGLLQTDYVALCGDDDFMLPKALRACVDFLDANADYAACGGQALGFDSRLGLRAFVRYEKFRTFDLAQGDASSRTLAYFADLSPASVYSVCRTQFWAEAMQLWSQLEFPVYAIGEVQFEFHMASRGKIRRLSILHWLRSHERAHGTHARLKGQDKSLSKALSVPALWTAAAHAGLKAEVLEKTAALSAQFQGRPIAEVHAEFDAAVAAYVEYIAPSPQDARARRGTWLDRSAAKLRKRLNRLHLPYAIRLWQLEREGIICPHAEVAQIAALVATHHSR